MGQMRALKWKINNSHHCFLKDCIDFSCHMRWCSVISTYIHTSCRLIDCFPWLSHFEKLDNHNVSHYLVLVSAFSLLVQQFFFLQSIRRHPSIINSIYIQFNTNKWNISHLCKSFLKRNFAVLFIKGAKCLW